MPSAFFLFVARTPRCLLKEDPLLAEIASHKNCELRIKTNLRIVRGIVRVRIRIFVYIRTLNYETLSLSFPQQRESTIFKGIAGSPMPLGDDKMVVS